jgi:hypothetical protein
MLVIWSASRSGSDLQRQRYIFTVMLGQRGLALLEHPEQGVEFGTALQLAQVLGVFGEEIFTVM